MQEFLFLKTPDQLKHSDAKIKNSKKSALLPSQVQEDLVDSAFGLLCPFQETVLTVNARNFVMILLSIEDPTLQKEESADRIPEEEKRLSQLIRQSYTMPLDDVS